MIRSLTIESLNDHIELEIDHLLSAYVFCSNIDWIFQILQLSPSLQELTMSLPDERIELSNHIFQNMTVTKLEITDHLDSSEYSRFLKFMSLKLPKLRKLFLQYYDSSDEEEYGSPITINMPNTNFDLLHWEHLEACTDIDNTFVAYIRLQTEYNVNFYIGKKSGAFPIKINKQYKQAVTNNLFHFNILVKA